MTKQDQTAILKRPVAAHGLGAPDDVGDSRVSPQATWDLAAKALRDTAAILDQMVRDNAISLVEIEVRARRIDQMNEENRRGLERLLSGGLP